MTELTLRAGRYQTVSISGVRDLTRDDLKVLAQPRAKLSAAERFKDSHHRIARLFAAGLRHADVQARTGYSEGRVSTLHADPAFQELIASYRKQVDEAFVVAIDEYFEVATGNMLTTERMIAQRLAQHEEDGDLPALKVLDSISQGRADRFGYGKHNTSTNINVDFAAKLDRAIKRSGKQIEGVPSAPLGRGGPNISPPAPGPSLPPPLRQLRRA